MRYAAHVVDGTVAQVIVGSAAFGSESLGGDWQPCDDSVGIGWLWDGQQFDPPPSPDLDI